ncbi:RIP metalloprotease RseP [Mariprofundus erugo]|uniref:Zinc metalloprotease n=1 Tax=Mariprofundus erugo TaxID=2528639 RepID=A0A5R9GLB3_9PROT|nr:RIP metalloprotease RseP [Mariprofundus erugo]TLS67266.1 RIP metalloprotease RseP [Mariprofundus erugo]TLS76521.1 RIP metalloprotease RseP [Mariprofundus erugo]
MMEILHSSLAFIVAIALLIAVHEYGHYTVARRLGIRVEKFSVGFGPALFSWRSRDGEVQYVIAAIPLGGYVKMLGENPDEQGAEQQAKLTEEERARAFHLQPVWKRAAVAFAGPALNFVFAIFAYMLVGWLGQSVLPTIVGHVTPASIAEQAGLQPGDRVLTVDGTPVHSWQQMEEQLKHEIGKHFSLTISRDERPVSVEMTLPEQEKDPLLLNVADSVAGFNPGLTIRVDEVIGGSPAERAGLQSGDIIRQINDWPVANVNQFIEQIRSSAGHEVAVVVQRGETLLQLHVLPVSDEQNQVRIGVRLASQAQQEAEIYRMGPVDGFVYGFTRTWDMTVMTLSVFGKMVTAAISPDNLGGPIAIAQLAGKTADLGLVYFIGFLALISVNLGVLNLLPVPILDGGMLVYLALEKVRGKALPPRFLEITQMIGLVLIVGLMVFAFYNDISRLFRG